MKQVTITLEDYRRDIYTTKKPYRVKKLINTIEYKIGDFLSEEDVSCLINHNITWKVVIVERKR